MKKCITMALSEDLVAKIDEIRGLASRSAVCEEVLKNRFMPIKVGPNATNSRQASVIDGSHHPANEAI